MEVWDSVATMDAHDRAVAVIAASIREYYSRKEAFRIYHGSTNSTRKSQYKRSNMVDTSGLSKVLNIDTKSMTALVEPNVAMDSLIGATLKHGLIPPVVMEFPGITVGGGFAGTAGESSSFKYGFFDRTINWIEMVLANGDTVKASSTERPDLFFGAASSFGTLGVTTLLEIQLIEAKTYVELTYFPVTSILEAQERIDEAARHPPIDYIDGIMYAQNRGVICTGSLTNDSCTWSEGRGFHQIHRPMVLHSRRKTDEETNISYQGSNSNCRLSFPLRSWRILGGKICIQVFHHPLQPHHTLHLGLFHAHPSHVSCTPPERAL